MSATFYIECAVAALAIAAIFWTARRCDKRVARIEMESQVKIQLHLRILHENYEALRKSLEGKRP